MDRHGILQQFEAARLNDAGILGGGEFEGLVCEGDGFFDARENGETVGWGMLRGDQKGMIAAGVDAGGGSHGEGAGVIGIEPFELGRTREITAGCLSERRGRFALVESATLIV